MFRLDPGYLTLSLLTTYMVALEDGINDGNIGVQTTGQDERHGASNNTAWPRVKPGGAGQRYVHV
jgi:hypothetical protein